jgi:murein DD-endopeptidase MepM/ murein hydrolase activator NlpD
MGDLMMRVLRSAVGFALTLMVAWAHGAGYPLRVEPVQDEDGLWMVVVHNSGSVPVYAEVKLVNLVNVRPGGQGSEARVLEPGAKEPMAIAAPVDIGAKMKFDWELKWTFGRGTARGNHDGIYRPPFPADMTFDTNNTAATHAARELNAIDILMPAGTRVIAARSGTVMDVAGEDGGDRVADGERPFYILDQEARRLGSYVRIMHDDGTWAEYQRLKPGSIKVTPGQKVEAGTQIALSGEPIGTDPHITFVVMKTQVGFTEPVSLPLKMEMAGRGLVPVKPGNAMGASLSVDADPKALKGDPLLLAKVEKPPVRDEKQGVFGAGQRTRIKPLGWQAYGALIAGLLILVAGGCVAILMRKRKSGLSWGAWWKRLSNKTSEAESEEAAAKSGKSFKSDVESLRPLAGYLIAEWETNTHTALCLAMKEGFCVLPKVSLARVFDRPLTWRKDEALNARMRRESMDFVVVRQRDWKMVAAVDIRRNVARDEQAEAVEELKADLLKPSGLTYVIVDGTEGPDKLRKLLRGAMEDEWRHEARKLTAA